MKKLDIITQPCGSHALRISLYLGPKRKRMRICIGLETHDYMEAQRRALLLLRYNKRLGIYDREIPEESEITYPEKTDDLPLFRDDNEIQSEMVTPVDIFRRKKIDARPMSTRERAMLPAAERVNSILRRTLKKRSFCNASPTCLTTFYPAKSRRSYFRTVRQQRWA